MVIHVIQNQFTWNAIVLFTTFVVMLVAFLKWTFSYWDRQKVPNLKPTIPFGNIKKMVLKQLNFGEQFREIYDQINAKGWKHAGIYIATRPTYFPIDPEIIKTIMQTDFQHFVNHGHYINEEVDPLSAHLFALEDAKWRNLRAKLTPTFTSAKMKMMFPTMANCAIGLQHLMEQAAASGKPVEIKEILGRFTTDIIGSTAFGLDCNCLKNPDTDFQKYSRMMIEGDFWQTLREQIAIIVPRSILQFFRFKLIRNDVERFFMNVVKDTVVDRERRKVFRNDFLHMLLQLKNRGKLSDDEKITDADGKINEGTLTINQLAAQVVIFFLAGFESSSTTMTFALYELAQNQDIQDRLRTEIKEVLDMHNGQFSYDAIMEMTYMDQIIYGREKS